MKNIEGMYVVHKTTIMELIHEGITEKLLTSLIKPQPRKHENSKYVIIDFSGNIDKVFERIDDFEKEAFGFSVCNILQLANLIVNHLKLHKKFKRCNTLFIENVVYSQKLSPFISSNGICSAPPFKVQCSLNQDRKKVLMILDEINMVEKVFRTKFIDARNFKPLYMMV